MDLRDQSLRATDVIAALGLQPHPEGGHFRELWRDSPADGSRGAATSILFLLGPGEHSHWHKVDAAEIWLWQAGGVLTLDRTDGASPTHSLHLGPDLAAGQHLQAVIPAHHWQAARPLYGWCLVSCIVAPAFSFNGFELAPHGTTFL